VSGISGSVIAQQLLSELPTGPAQAVRHQAQLKAPYVSVLYYIRECACE
jgi:hypothetical protein